MLSVFKNSNFIIDRKTVSICSEKNTNICVLLPQNNINYLNGKILSLGVCYGVLFVCLKFVDTYIQPKLILRFKQPRTQADSV